MTIHVQFFGWAILTHEVGQTDLVSGVCSGFICRSEDANVSEHISENFSKHISLIHYLSFLAYAFCNACLDMYVRQAIELRVLLLLLIVHVSVCSS